jgi:cysteine desulfurase
MGIYLDHQATSPMVDEVKDAYVEALQVVGNPSSIHRAGQAARALLEGARERIAAVLDCEPVEVVLTSGGTEAINQALKGAVWAAKSAAPDNPTRIAAPATEHHATLDALAWLARAEGTQHVALRVDGDGVADLAHCAEVVGGDNTGTLTLLTTLLANNEVGSLQPVTQMVEYAREARVPVHVDAIAALGYIPVSFSTLGATAMSVSAHKVGGPVGVGALILSRHAPAWEALHHGGDQQRSRSGTLDAAGAVAFATALEVRDAQRRTGATELALRRDRLREGILHGVPQAIVRGSRDNRLPGNLHITVPGCEGDVMLYLLDEQGINVSTGSACQAGVSEPSHVLLAMGVSDADSRGALRFSLSYSHTDADIDQVIAVFPDVVSKAEHAGLSAG